MTMIRLNDSGVIFNREEHTYHLEGKELSGITSVIQRQLEKPHALDPRGHAVLTL